MNALQENICEISMLVGYLIALGHLPKEELDLDSTTLSTTIVGWAQEFEEKYGRRYGFEVYDDAPAEELGGAKTYFDAIDNFTLLKLRNAGWLTNEYVNSIDWWD